VSLLYLAPMGSAAGEAVDRMEKQLARTFRLPTKRLGGLTEPPSAHDPSRGQWRSDEVLKDLLCHLPDDASRLLGVSERDLFLPILTFVYGQAQLHGKVAVVSLARLRPEFHGLPPDPELLAERAGKEAVHEVGHTFGLVHCLDQRCPMALSTGLAELDLKTAEPCPSCSALLAGSLDMHRTRSEDRGRREG